MKKILIAAVCARPFVQAAAKAGYAVTALDAFADADTRAAAQASFSVAYENGAFAEQDFERVLRSLKLDDYAGMVYGSGFEAAPGLLDKAAEYLPVLGNASDVVRRLKQPQQFFALLDTLNIPHPEVSFKPRQNAAGWLYKQDGGSGGTHVRKVAALAPGHSGYYQREMAGIPVSLLFAADERQARAIGFNQQWLAASPSMPYRYGGAVSNVQLPEAIRQQLVRFAQLLTAEVGLRGLNSIDAIMDGEKLWLLEINPRLSATFDLYDMDGSLFELHMLACGGDQVDKLACDGDMQSWPLVPMGAKAHQIIYAAFDLIAPGETSWPDWVADIPLSASYIVAGNPVCSVLAEADNAVAAKELVEARAGLITAMIENYRIDF